MKNARIYWAVREMQRIEIVDGALPKRDKDWLDERLHGFEDLAQMTRPDEGFLESKKAYFVPPSPDSRYDLLSGEQRLKALEAALSKSRTVWDDDPAKCASDWIRQQGNSTNLIADFESLSDSGASFERVWGQFGWAHSPVEEQGGGVAQRDLLSECTRVLSLLTKLPEVTVRQTINALSHWFYSWEKHVVSLPDGLTVWLKLWPIAVDATNADQPADEEVDLNIVAQSSDKDDPMDLDTLNTPAGKLVGVFLAACPNLSEIENPFGVDGAPLTMRDTVIASRGRSGLIARHRMIEALPYFLRADPEWTRKHLLELLMSESTEALALWRALARRVHCSKVLKIIGDQMTERATDSRLGRETRNRLVFSLVLECLNAFREQRDPAVPYVRIQQMIRTLEDEERASAAGKVQIFVRDFSKPPPGEESPPSPEELFVSAATPFLEKVWPQERSLTTPGVSKALADLPATAGEKFAESVDVIERFLVPFECWSMLEYGLWGDEEGTPKLLSINNQEKAAAFLRLLDLTIGTHDGAVIPHGLGEALDQIRNVTPALTTKQEFRRLETAARRK